MAVRSCLLPLLLAASTIAAPALAQSDSLSELDDLADVSADPQSGLALARDQIGEGDLTGAVATLERLLIDHPQTDEALVLHASLLCRLDDKEGARIELAELRFGIPDQVWGDVTAACGRMTRPGGKGR
jgi:Flp pilus assembly protein TadD